MTKYFYHSDKKYMNAVNKAIDNACKQNPEFKLRSFKSSRTRWYYKVFYLFAGKHVQDSFMWMTTIPRFKRKKPLTFGGKYSASKASIMAMVSK